MNVNALTYIYLFYRHFKWSYVAVVYSDSEYGIHCYESLRELAGNDSICFATPHRVIRYQFQGSDYEQIMRSIESKPEIKGTTDTICAVLDAKALLIMEI